MRVLVCAFIGLFLFPLLGVGQRLVMPQFGPGPPVIIDQYQTNILETGEVVPIFTIETVHISAERLWNTEEERRNYLLMRRHVMRVLPYAIYAQRRYEQLDEDLATAKNRREERRLIKECEQEIKHKINTEVKNLSVTQGKILIKLIERQTGNTSYDLVKEMKGGVTAFLYQGVAKVFGHNLKSSFDPEEDYLIEGIIKEFERTRPVSTRGRE